MLEEFDNDTNNLSERFTNLDEKEKEVNIISKEGENLPTNLHEYFPKNHTIKIAILAIFAALGAALSSLFIYFPYIELMTVTIFIGGVILGPIYGLGLAIITTSLYEIIATLMMGPGLVIFPFKIIALSLIALIGALLSKRITTESSLFWNLFIASIGGLLTIFYDTITNIGWILFASDFNTIGYFTALLTGLPITAAKAAANVVIFFFVPNILNRALKPLLNRV